MRRIAAKDPSIKFWYWCLEDGGWIPKTFDDFDQAVHARNCAMSAGWICEPIKTSKEQDS